MELAGVNLNQVPLMTSQELRGSPFTPWNGDLPTVLEAPNERGGPVQKYRSVVLCAMNGIRQSYTRVNRLAISR